jgi:hypothetical protein
MIKKNRSANGSAIKVKHDDAMKRHIIDVKMSRIHRPKKIFDWPCCSGAAAATLTT